MCMTFGRKKTAPVNAQVDASFDGAACKGVVPEVHTEMMGERANNAGVWLFSAVVFALCFAVVAGAWLALCGRIGAVALPLRLSRRLMGIMATHIASQWEKVVVLRLGKFDRVSGPGLFWTIPIIEQNVMRVDGRMRVTPSAPKKRLRATWFR